MSGTVSASQTQCGHACRPSGSFVALVIFVLLIYGSAQVLRFSPIATVSMGVWKLSGLPSNISYHQSRTNFSIDAVGYLEALNLDLGEVDKTLDTNWNESGWAFVTATSSNHFRQSLRMIKSFHLIYPNETLLVYNLGLLPDAVRFLMSKFHFIQVIPFNFAIYPWFVRNLFEYRWKPLAIAEVLARSNSKLLWMDTSTVLLKQFDPKWLTGIELFEATGHSLLATTNPLMFNYLLIGNDTKRLEETPMMGANVVAMRGSQAVKLAVLRWWVLCALEQDCMAPKGSKISCAASFDVDPIHRYADCHRFDQSALNLLLAHSNGFNVSAYTGVKFFETDRS